MEIGSGTVLPPVHTTWPHQVAIGDRCLLEHGIYFKYDGIYAPGPSIKIGDRVFVGTGCEFNVRKGITIASDSLIAAGCRFIDHDHGFTLRDIPIRAQKDGVESPITVEEDVWLGANVIVLKGVTIGRGAIVAAGSVVTKSIRKYEIWGGVPARFIRERPPQEPQT